MYHLEEDQQGRGNFLAILKMDGALIVELARLDPATEAKQEIGLVHLGQTLNLSLLISSKHEPLVTSSIVLELQTSNQRINLLKVEETATTPIDLPTVHEVKELGVHVVSCTVTLQDGQSIKRFFKFNAAAPFHLKTKVNLSLPKRAFVEAQLANASTITFFIDRIAFISNTELDIGKLSLDRDLVYENVDFALHPRSSYQFVFDLRCDTQFPSILGKMAIEWRSASGDSGRLQTGPVKLPDTIQDPVTVKASFSEELRLFHPADMSVELKNTTSRCLYDLRFGFDDAKVFSPIGEGFVEVDKLETNESINLTLKVIPVQQGIPDCTDFALTYLDDSITHRFPQTLHFFIKNK